MFISHVNPANKFEKSDNLHKRFNKIRSFSARTLTLRKVRNFIILNTTSVRKH